MRDSTRIVLCVVFTLVLGFVGGIWVIHDPIKFLVLQGMFTLAIFFSESKHG